MYKSIIIIIISIVCKCRRKIAYFVVLPTSIAGIACTYHYSEINSFECYYYSPCLSSLWTHWKWERPFLSFTFFFSIFAFCILRLNALHNFYFFLDIVVGNWQPLHCSDHSKNCIVSKRFRLMVFVHGTHVAVDYWLWQSAITKWNNSVA